MGIDLHRHDEYSSFDGFGKALALARLAKEKGLTALGIANHGNMNGIVEHWKACIETGIKPVLGVEGYFQPKFNKKNPKRDSFHLCLFAKDLQGYKNINKIMTKASVEQRYYKPLIDFKLLEEYSEGVICTSGCIASFISQLIVKGRKDVLYKAVEKFIDIFGDNFYIELQPYKLDERTPEEKNLQEKVNVELIKLAKKYKLPMVLTSDSHYGSEHDYDTYCKMHEIKGSGEFNETYRERYMPNQKDLINRFVKMHGKDFKDIKKLAKRIQKDMNELEESIEGDILGKLKLELPKISNDSARLLKKNLVKGLDRKGKKNKNYMNRVKHEYNVITHHGFEDYFLIVQDYVNFAKRNYDAVSKDVVVFWKDFNKRHGYSEKPIKVGPGRGSVCNSLAAYALEITDVDPVYFDIDFNRFMRMDKKKMPDIDLDFEDTRRDEVIHYIVERYGGKAAQICSYGLYKVDNLLNDLAKVCGVGHWETDEKGKEKFIVNKDEIKRIKDYCSKRADDDAFDYNKWKHEPDCRYFDKTYDNIILHFSKMFTKVRFIGTHAAGVAIVGGDLLDYTSLQVTGSKDKGTYRETTSYNLNNLEEINVVKFDMLGLRTLSITKELEDMTDECFTYEWLEDETIYDFFKEGKTDGVFQFESGSAKGILTAIEADSIHDVIAASALNRPGPLQLKMPEHYAESKLSGLAGDEPWAEITNKTHGTIVYQEQIQQICIQIGMLSYEESDKIMGMMKNKVLTEAQLRAREKEALELRKKFVKGCKQTKDMSDQQANALFDKMLVYSFNQGHSTGYSLISVEQMYYKAKHPEMFWYVTLKYAKENDLFRLKSEAVREGNIILLPHVNYGAKYSIVTIDGENALAEGLSNIKGVGPKAADAIEEERKKNGKYKSKEDFIERVPKRTVNSGVIRKLEESGALLFNKSIYFERVQKYNSTLYIKSIN